MFFPDGRDGRTFTLKVSCPVHTMSGILLPVFQLGLVICCSLHNWVCLVVTEVAVVMVTWLDWGEGHASSSSLGACRGLCRNTVEIGSFLFHYFVTGTILVCYYLWINGMNFHQAGRNHRRSKWVEKCTGECSSTGTQRSKYNGAKSNIQHWCSSRTCWSSSWTV